MNSPHDPHVSSDTLPVIAILNYERDKFPDFKPSKEVLMFCYQSALHAIDSLIEKRYSDFDALITTNCCHGIALLVRDLILELKGMDLKAIQEEGKRHISELEKTNEDEHHVQCKWSLAKPLISLTCLYLLGFIRELDPQRGSRSAPKKLKSISPLSSKFSIKTVDKLQERFAKKVALRYASYVKQLKPELKMNFIPIEVWGKYIQPEHIRVDKRGNYYASNLYSMQIALAYLICSRAKLVLVNDLLSVNGELKGRHISVYEGDGSQNLKQVPLEHIAKLDPSEPVVVFGGCAYSDDLTIDVLNERLDPWLTRLPDLVLACDVFYPEFPKVGDDESFDSSPIAPTEDALKEVIGKFSKIEGMSIKDPSLFCLTHIYPSSLQQILEGKDGKDLVAIPINGIPGRLSSSQESEKPENFDVLSLVGEEFGKGFSALNHLLPKNYLTHTVSDVNAVKNGLMNYLLVLTIFEDALDAFVKQKYRMFDALVGNNTCYSVAYAIFLIAYRSKNHSDFKACISQVIANIAHLKSAVLEEMNSFKKNLKLSCSNFESFLNEKNLAIAVDVSLVYLFLAFTCCIAKRKNENDVQVVDFDRLSEKYSPILDIKKPSVVKLIKQWQKSISVLNVEVLQNGAKDLSYPETLWARYIFDQYVIEDQSKRLCTPSLFATRVIYDTLLTMPGSLIGLQVNLVERPKKFISRFTLYFEIQNDGSARVLEQGEISSIHPVYMFAGCRYVTEGTPVDINSVKKEFSQRNLQELIFAHEVTYPQYPKSLNIENISPVEPELIEEIERLKANRGFSFEDPSDLCLVHLFVDDTQTQSFALHEPPTYLPGLNCLDD